MPIISMFLGILIRMNYDDHNPPHFHAYYQDYEGSFNFDGEMINGDMPARQKKFISAWSEFHQDELKANWEISREKGEMFRIDPLRF